MARSRAEQALRRYQDLGDHWHTEHPSLGAAADIAVDAAIALEASLKCVADQSGIRRGEDKPPALFRTLRKAGRLPRPIAFAVDDYQESVDVLFRARNVYLHAGLPTVEPLALGGVVRDALRMILLFAEQDPLLGSEWPDLAKTLWEFDGQPHHFAAQVRTTFAGRHFDNVPLHAQVTRFTGGSALFLGGALRAVSDVEQSRWDWSGSAGGIARLLPDVKVEVGMIAPPHSEEMKKAPGEKLAEGTLQLNVRDLSVTAEGFDSAENPLARPHFPLPKRGQRLDSRPGRFAARAPSDASPVSGAHAVVRHT